MARVLVLYYSMYGHIEAMAQAVAQGAREAAASKVDILRVPELLSDDALRRAGGKADQPARLAQPGDLAGYDAILFGTPARLGNMAGAMRHFLDQCGGLCASGALVGKIGSVFTSGTARHGGQESTVLAFHASLLHMGLIIVGQPHVEDIAAGDDETMDASPYGASTFAGNPHGRMPSEQELSAARDQGRHVTAIAARLFA